MAAKKAERIPIVNMIRFYFKIPIDFAHLKCWGEQFLVLKAKDSEVNKGTRYQLIKSSTLHDIFKLSINR